MSTASAPVTPFLKLRAFAETYPILPRSGVRRLIYARHSNGLAESGAILVLSNRQFLIHVEKFLRWMESKGGNGE
jgi:hypothetical protein